MPLGALYFCVCLTQFSLMGTRNWSGVVRWYNPSNYFGKFFQLCIHFPGNPLLCSSYEDLLRDAVDLGHLKTVAELLQYPNIDINKGDSLLSATCKDNVAMVKLLLTHPSIDVNKGSPLSRAVYNNNMEIVELLFAHTNIDINRGYLLPFVSKQIELMKLFLKHPSIILAAIGKTPLNELRLWNALVEIAQTDWKTIESLHTRNQITNEEFLYHFPEEITYANTPSLLTQACAQAIKEEDNIFFGDWDSEQKIIRWYPLFHRSFVDFCITSKGNLNNRNRDGLRPFDIVSSWYLPSKNVNGEKEQLYYRLLRRTSALSCQTLYDGLRKKHDDDIAGKLMESYLTVMIPKLPSEALTQKINALKTESNKIQ